MSTNINIDFEKIQVIIDYVIDTDIPTHDSVINLLLEANFTQENAENWVNQFTQVMCNFLGFEVDINNCFTWIKSQANLGKTSDIITEQLIGMFGTLLSTTNVVIIYKDGVLYKEFSPYNETRAENFVQFIGVINEISPMLKEFSDTIETCRNILSLIRTQNEKLEIIDKVMGTNLKANLMEFYSEIEELNLGNILTQIELLLRRGN
jgi:hypothetical protein